MSITLTRRALSPLSGKLLCAVSLFALSHIALAAAPGESVERLVLDAQTAFSSHDYGAALTRYKEAAELGNSIAMFQLGAMYESGQGVPANISEAAKWYERAAQAGSVPGMKRLANMYLDGQVVGKSFDKAAALYSKAGDLGDSNALLLLGQLYWTGASGERRPKDAVNAFELAVRLGNGHAMNALGIAYQLGDGVAQSNATAYAYFGLAAEFGDRAATGNSDKARRGLSSAEIADSERLRGEIRRNISIGKTAE